MSARGRLRSGNGSGIRGWLRCGAVVAVDGGDGGGEMGGWVDVNVES